MFQVTDNKGFHMEFANGFKASVQWGRGNYCDNKFHPGHWGEEVPPSRDAEVAAFDPEGNMIDMPHGDQVQGYLSANEVLRFLNAVAALSFEGMVVPLLPEN
jgi:hypothetical protein